MSVQASVVVPTYNRPDLLRNCLEALLKQDFRPADYEIIVVDNAGSAATRSLVEAFAGNNVGTDATRMPLQKVGVRPAIYYLAEADRPGPAAARNAGWHFAHGEFIAFTDDDCLPEPAWLKEGVKQLLEGYDAITGRMIVPASPVPSDYEKNVSRLATAEFLTANCFFRCSALLATGGFDERFTSAWREDSDLHFSLLALSLKLGQAPAATVVHPVRPAPWGISLKEQRKSMFNALLFKKHPALYREHIQSRPPLRYYAILASGLVFAVSVVAGWGYVALGAAVLWLGWTAQFALQRLDGTRHDLPHVAEMIVSSILIPPLSVFWRLYGAIKYRVWFL